ncbi:hypothetical protein [Seohaeicola zhoushanensis]|uniref:Clp protease n=1 Tax=Seohaeicola zhoushanensis TaxID=1569283 RepID=A0A8J3M7P5_9RHOB|nr:hypothetical protein [Seohaeicola zhoushanensis]GHF36476.1 hypothetical protein GCM10017056_05400 [Seohaeicola zhoushanensis]
MRSLLTVLALLVAAPLLAQPSGGKFRLDGATLVYDTEAPGPEESGGIVSEDVAVLLQLLRANPGITTLRLNSSGGEVYAAAQIKDIVIDFELDTEVHGDCDSSCVTILLGGTKRAMSRGSRIGFHQVYWSAENIASYYETEREMQGWNTPFDFASWMYLDTQAEVYANLRFLISRGVDPAFAIETIRDPQSEVWRPSRAELLAGGVLTE